ncbi:MAG: 50S ribosomal protein L18 [Desulfomonile tiedjei]|uniref:Large ribosomal subunit protein uL18 n=1 Tax=Desulfomonile tiedjei TaxID=2358 RepID=A0A9D6V823_9BACT|nr:50S ribosomal protein L18 [Desulfomonile tiedjei]
MSHVTEKLESRKKRTRRMRYRIAGNPDRQRLTVFRSNKNIFAQIIDDAKGVTLVQASTLDKGFRRKAGDPFNRDTAREVGRRLATRAKELNITKVIFDRGPYLYHGKVKALADGAREGGLDF